MKQKVKSEISDSAAKTLKLQTKFVIIKMPVRQVIHSYLSSFLYPASTGSYFAKTRQRKEKNKKLQAIFQLQSVGLNMLIILI